MRTKLNAFFCKRISFLTMISLMILSSVGPESFAASAHPIDDVRIIGAPADQVEMLRTLSGYLPGDEVEPVRAERAISKLKEHFESKGYPQSKITYDVEQVHKEKPEKGEKTVLFFHVVPGPAVHIMSVQFLLKNGEFPADLLFKMNQAIDFKSGELYDRDRIKEMRRAVESSLSALNFVDSRVLDISTEGTDAGGVKIAFQIELGQRVIFSVFGNERFTRTELMALVEEQRSQGLGRDYITVIANRLRDYYVDNGFKYVVITPYTFEPKNSASTENREPRKVAFNIEEGARVMIKRITFDGNEYFNQDQLNDLFFKNAPDRVQARIYNEKMVDESARSMIGEIKNKGFLSSKLIAIKTEETGEDHSVDIKIFINEGLQTKVQVVEFKGNHVFTPEKLTEFLGLKEGDPLSLLQLENGLDRLKREYRNLGYLNAGILNEERLVVYSEKNQFAYLSIEVSEGVQFRLAGYNFFGNDATRNVVIERELQIKVGEPLAENKLIDTEDRLRRLGIFAQVKIELQDDPSDPVAKIMKISVVEATPGDISGGIGLRNDLGVRVFGQVAYTNLWGLDHSWVFGLTGNRRLSSYRFLEYTAEISYIWPYFTLGETTFRPSLSVEKREYRQFDAETYAFSASFERMLYKPLKISSSMTYTLEQIRQFDAANAKDNHQLRIGSVTPLLRMDLRDNSLAPRRGFYALTSFEYANVLLGSQSNPAPISYGRFQLRTDYYLDFIPRVVWYTSFRGGWLRNFVSQDEVAPGGDRSIPLIKQFALGGINSMRGYTDQEINVQNQGITNSSTYVNYRTQMDFMASTNLSFGPFLDAGNLKVDHFTMGDLLYGTGVGMRYLTPVGPVNFDWGFKLFPKNGADANVFYFSLGVI